jgi:hypothetical protein
MNSFLARFSTPDISESDWDRRVAGLRPTGCMTLLSGRSHFGRGDQTEDQQQSDSSSIGTVDEDERLLSMVRSGDADALGEVFDRYGDHCLGVACQILEQTAAEDAVYDAFVQLWREPPTTSNALRHWLAEATRSVASRRSSQRVLAEPKLTATKQYQRSAPPKKG